MALYIIGILLIVVGIQQNIPFAYILGVIFGAWGMAITSRTKK